MPLNNYWPRLTASFVSIIIIYKLLSGISNSSSSFSSPSAWSSYGIFSSAVKPLEPDANGFLEAGSELDEYCGHYRWQPFADRTRRRKIFSLMIINTELEWLEIQMGETASEVDYFIIVESTLTFSDLEKPLFVRDNWGRFAKYHDKMILHTLNMTGLKNADAWARENFSRNAMFDQVFPNLKGEQKAWPGDVIIIGDVDEIVRPDILRVLRNCEFPQRTRLRTKIYYYSFQWISQGHGFGDWDHPDVTYFDGFKNTLLPQTLREGAAEGEIWNAGWHCSFCFDLLADIVTKVKSYSHQEMNRPEIVDPKVILERVRSGEDLFARAGSDCRRVENNVDIPSFLSENRERFKYALDRDPQHANFVDYWDIFGEVDRRGR